MTDGHRKQDAAIVNSYDIRTGQGAWCGFFMSGRKDTRRAHIADSRARLLYGGRVVQHVHRAGVAKLVDARDLKSLGLAAMRVRSPPPACLVFRESNRHFAGGWSMWPQCLQVRASSEP